METKHEEIEQIKKTINVNMAGNKNEVWLSVGNYDAISIPIKIVFQVKRGLESYVQRFYRRKK